MKLSRRMALVLAVVVLGTTACGDDTTRTASTDTTEVGTVAPVVIELAGGAGPTAVAESTGGPAADDMSTRMAWQQYEFDGELPATDPTGAAWVFPADAELREAAMLGLAQAFGIEGGVEALPVDQGEGWVVGSADFTGASLRVSKTATFDWYFSPGPVDSDPVIMTSCQPAAAASPEGSTGTEVAPPTAVPGDGSVAPDAPSVVPGGVAGCDTVAPEPPVGVPTATEAGSRTVALMNAAGLDPSAYEVESSGDEWGAYVTAWLLIDGHRSPVGLNVGFGAEGAITWASGMLGTPQSAGDYPLLDAAAAIERLNDQSGRWYGDGGVVAMDDAAATSGSADAGAGESVVVPDGQGSGEGSAPSDVVTIEPVPAVGPVDCAAYETTGGDPSGAATDEMPAGCLPLPSGPITVVLTGVRNDLTMLWDADGAVWLLPAFTFLGGDGSEFSVLAVDDSFLQSAG